MKPQPRIRKTVKWGGAVVSVVLLAAWIGSGWWYAAYESQYWTLGLTKGLLGVVYNLIGEIPMNGGWSAGFPANPEPRRWWFLFFHNPIFVAVSIPLWVPALLSMAVTGIAWRFDNLARRARAGFCPKCGYSRTGLARGAVCPECGGKATAQVSD